jgi:hypothetical protein
VEVVESRTMNVVDYKQEVVPEIPDDISIPFPLPNGNVFVTSEAQ